MELFLLPRKCHESFLTNMIGPHKISETFTLEKNVKVMFL